MTHAIRLTQETLKEASRAMGAAQFARYLQRADSPLTTLAKVQVGQQLNQFLEERIKCHEH